MRLWRICSALHPVWSGEGARLKGGRWNQPGTPAIYAATSYASAVLEILVHGNIGRMPRGFRYVTIDIPDDARIDRVAPDAVAGWEAMPPHPSCEFGDAWLRGREALVLLVPSVVTNGLDLNAVVNPMHRDFARIVVGDEQTVRWDARLLAPRGGGD
jgi:RES domain-containing protein